MLASNTGIIFGLIGVVVVVLFIIIYIISTNNKFRRMEVKIREAESGIDVSLTKRYDVLVKMLDVCKNYMAYEKSVIIETIKLRTNMSMNERVAAENKMNELYGNIKWTAENYPQLASANNFATLQSAIVETENHLQAARRLYNSNVSQYNSLVVSFPASIIAGMIGATQKEFFVADQMKRNDVPMNF